MIWGVLEMPERNDEEPSINIPAHAGSLYTLSAWGNIKARNRSMSINVEPTIDLEFKQMKETDMMTLNVANKSRVERDYE